MRICFVVRTIYSQITTYTTTHIAFEAQKRGHEVFYTTVNSFSCTDDLKVRATVVSPGSTPIESRAEFLRALQSENAERSEVILSDFDVVFLRHNPNESKSDDNSARSNPALEFGRLLKLHGVFVANDPAGLTKASSKMYLSSFPAEVRARTLITRSPVKVKEFLKSIKKPAIIKPLNGFGGQDVFFIKNAKEMNINQIISTVSKNGYIIAQEYLPAVKKGDKRLLLLNGSPITIGKTTAIYRRMSPKGDVRSNMHVGGTRKRVEFTKVEAKIVEMIRPKLMADGLYFVGADIVGNKLLEINVFCPGGINNINELYDINVGEAVIEDLEKRVKQKKVYKRGIENLALVKALP